VQVEKLMSTGVATIEATESARDALTRMLARRIRHLPVVDAHGTLLGVVTDRDLRHYLFSPGVFKGIGSVSADALLKSIAVKDVMSAPAVSVAPDDDLEAAARCMVRRKIGSLPVVDHGRVVGIITEIDLLRHIVRAEEAEIVVSFP